MIKIENLNEAYNQTIELFDTEVNDGKEILFQMETLITNLKEHWKGKDSYKHINRLIGNHERLQSFLDVTIESTRQTMASVITLQQARQANGGGGQIGDIKESVVDFLSKVNYIDETEEYYIDPLISEDYKLLEEVEEKMQTFDRKISTQRENLLANWILGYNRKEIVENFENIEMLGEKTERDITNMKTDLLASINNANLIIDK